MSKPSKSSSKKVKRQQFRMEDVTLTYELRRNLIPNDDDFCDSGTVSIHVGDKKVGSFHFSVFNVMFASNTGYPVMDVFDAVSSEAIEVYEELFDFEDGGIKKSVMKILDPDYDPDIDFNTLDLILIEHLAIEPAYQGRNLASYVLTRFMWDHSSISDIFVVNPFPIRNFHDEEKNKLMRVPKTQAEINAGKKRLQEMYSKLGFQKIRGSHLMIKGRRTRDQNGLMDTIIGDLIGME